MHIGQIVLPINVRGRLASEGFQTIDDFEDFKEDEEEKIMGIKDSEKPSRREMLRRRREARVKKETHTKSRQNANTNQKSNSGGSKIWDKKDLTKKTLSSYQFHTFIM